MYLYGLIRNTEGLSCMVYFVYPDIISRFSSWSMNIIDDDFTEIGGDITKSICQFLFLIFVSENNRV